MTNLEKSLLKQKIALCILGPIVLIMIAVFCLFILTGCENEIMNNDIDVSITADSYLFEKTFHQYSTQQEIDMMTSLLSCKYYDDIIDKYFNGNFESWSVFGYANPINNNWIDEEERDYLYYVEFRNSSSEWSWLDLDTMERVYETDEWLSNIKIYVRRK